MTDCLEQSRSFSFMESGIVHDHDTLCRELGKQHLFDPAVKNTAVDTEVKQSYCKQPVIMPSTNRIGLVSALPIIGAMGVIILKTSDWFAVCAHPPYARRNHSLRLPSVALFKMPHCIAAATAKAT